MINTFQSWTIEGSKRIQDSLLNLFSNLENLYHGKQLIEIWACMEANLALFMAKSDGNISKNELDIIKRFIDRNFGDKANHILIAKSIEITKKAIEDFSLNELVVCSQIMFDTWMSTLENELSMSGNDLQHVFIEMLSLIYSIALVDNSLHPKETEYFDKLCESMQIPADLKIYIQNIGEYNCKALSKENSNGFDISDALKFFKLENNFSLKDLNTAWNIFLKYHHPDYFHGKDDEIYKKVHDEFIKGKQYYDFLKGKANAESKSSISDASSFDKSISVSTNKDRVLNDVSKERSNSVFNGSSENSLIRRSITKIFESKPFIYINNEIIKKYKYAKQAIAGLSVVLILLIFITIYLIMNSPRDNYLETNKMAIVKTQIGLNLREKPGTGQRILAVIPYQGVFAVIAEGSNESHYNVNSKWYLINYKGIQGWIWGGLAERID
jgi:hypothetical protein